MVSTNECYCSSTEGPGLPLTSLYGSEGTTIIERLRNRLLAQGWKGEIILMENKRVFQINNFEGNFSAIIELFEGAGKRCGYNPVFHGIHDKNVFFVLSPKSKY